jgi:hypothetical protein
MLQLPLLLVIVLMLETAILATLGGATRVRTSTYTSARGAGEQQLELLLLQVLVLAPAKISKD